MLRPSCVRVKARRGSDMVVALPPTADDLLDYLNLTGANYPIEDAQDALEVASDLQAARCVTDPYLSPLREAALRRAARTLAVRGALLGFTDLGDFGGPVAVQRWDAQIEGLEADYRIGSFA